MSKVAWQKGIGQSCTVRGYWSEKASTVLREQEMNPALGQGHFWTPDAIITEASDDCFSLYFSKTGQYYGPYGTEEAAKCAYGEAAKLFGAEA